MGCVDVGCDGRCDDCDAIGGAGGDDTDAVVRGFGVGMDEGKELFDCGGEGEGDGDFSACPPLEILGYFLQKGLFLRWVSSLTNSLLH